MPPSTADSLPSAVATTSRRAPDRVAVVLAFASAAAASMHETVWARLLGRAVGNTSLGLGLALALLMAGIGLGSLGIVRSRFLWDRPRRGYLLAELTVAIGATALVAFCLAGSTPSVLLGLHRGALVVDIVLAALIALPASIAMGATYPLLVRSVVARVEDTALVTRLYAAGLFGAIAGLLSVALVVAPGLGLDRAAWLAAGVNVLVGLGGAFWLREREPAAETPAIARGDTRNEQIRFGAAGALGLGAQVVWNRCLTPYAGVSTTTFATIVAVYLLAQAVGFALVRRFGRFFDRETSLADTALALAAPLIVLLLGLLTRVATWLPSRDGSPAAWVTGVTAIVALVVGPPALLIGIAQAQALRRIEARGAGWDTDVARVVGVGTLASVVGTLGVTVFGIPYLGPRGSLAVLGAVTAAALLHDRRRGGAVLALVGVLVAVGLAPGPRWFLGVEFDPLPPLFARHDAQDTVAVVTRDHPLEIRVRRLVANGVSYSGDSIFAQRYMRLLAHLPAMAARGEQRALVICVGTGTTLDALRHHDYQQIDAVDISPSIRETLDLFRRVNHGAIDDPRVRLVIDDGARFLRSATDHYDVVTLEPPPPRAPGGSSLYTREFYRAARQHLRPGGALAQWLPLHDLSGAEAAAIVRTLDAEFPSVSLHLVERNEAVLVARTDPGPVAAVNPAVASDLERIGFAARGLDAWTDTRVLEGEPLRDAVGPGPILRDAWPYPEYAPLAGADGTASPLAAWLDRIQAVATPAQGSSAEAYLSIASAFQRVVAGTGSTEDRAAIHRTMLGLLRAQPDDVYRQYAFGYGALIEARVHDLVEDGDLPAARQADQMARIARRRASAEAR